MLIALLVMVFLLSLLVQEKTPNGSPVLSYRNLEVREYNLKISSAVKKGEALVFNPLSIVTRFHKVTDIRFININAKNDRTECPLKSVDTILEGYLDDAMQGK